MIRVQAIANVFYKGSVQKIGSTFSIETQDAKNIIPTLAIQVDDEPPKETETTAKPAPRKRPAG